LINRKRIDFFKKNWKLGIHLILYTRRFGVNNEWWNYFSSTVWGNPIHKILWDIIRIYPLVRNYKSMRFRAGALHFMTDEQYELAFGKTKESRFKQRRLI